MSQPFRYVVYISAGVHDSNMALSIIKQVKGNVKTQPGYYLMDSGYDSMGSYTSVRYDHKAQAIIPLNLSGAKEPQAGFDFDGTQICSAGYRMIYWGHEKNANKFRCPHIIANVIVPTVLPGAQSLTMEW